MVREGYYFGLPPFLLGVVAFASGWRWGILTGSVLVALAPHLLDFSLRIDDLAAHTSEALRARAGMHVFARLTLFALQRGHTAQDIVAELADWLDPLRDLVATLQGREDCRLWMRYIHRTADFSLQ